MLVAMAVAIRQLGCSPTQAATIVRIMPLAAWQMPAGRTAPIQRSGKNQEQMAMGASTMHADISPMRVVPAAQTAPLAAVRMQAVMLVKTRLLGTMPMPVAPAARTLLAEKAQTPAALAAKT